MWLGFKVGVVPLERSEYPERIGEPICQVTLFNILSLFVFDHVVLSSTRVCNIDFVCDEWIISICSTI